MAVQATQGMTVLKGFVKEAIRVYPVVPFLTRILRDQARPHCKPGLRIRIRSKHIDTGPESLFNLCQPLNKSLYVDLGYIKVRIFTLFLIIFNFKFRYLKIQRLYCTVNAPDNNKNTQLIEKIMLFWT